MRALATSAIVLAAFGCESVRDEVDSYERDLLAQFEIGDPPPSPSNAFADNEAAATLGHKLFFDRRLSGPLGASNGPTVPGSLGDPDEIGKVACVDCHDLTRGGGDVRSRPNASSLGSGWTGRNSPTVLNAAYSPWQFWDGRSDSVWSQAAGALEAGATHNGTRLEVAHTIFDHYRTEYEAIFGALPEDLADTSSTARFPTRGKPGMPAFDDMPEADRDLITRIHVNVGKAIAAFERKLVCKDSPFDQWLAGDEDAMSASAKRGMRLFIGRASCIECHNGPTFSDNAFHNTGAPQYGMRAMGVDVGRHGGIARVQGFPFNRASKWSDDVDDSHFAGLEAQDADLGTFKTPTLRCVEQTAPYKHNGVYETLWDVVDHYNFGGATGRFEGERSAAIKPLHLTDAELDDLVEFLRALTGAPLPESLTQAPEP